jgi:gamma-glutamylputrescine oxidase
MNLSYWEKTSFLSEHDFIIIGSGIVGCFAALRLKEKNPSAKVCIVERGFLPSGASTKNAGFATFGTVSELLENLKRSDENTVIDLTRKRWRGLQKMIHTFGKENIQLENSGGYELFRETDDELFESCVKNLGSINDLIKEVVFSDKSSEVFSVQDQKIKEFGFKNIKHLIANPLESSIDTGKMMQQLIRLTQCSGVTIYNHCEVHSIEDQHSKIVLNTSLGKFESKKIIVAVNAFAKKLIPEIDITPGRGQVLITKPIKGLKPNGTFHFDKGYYYFRNINDRILFGGGRNIDFKKEETYEFGHTEEVQSALVNYLKEMIIPGIDFEVDYTWSGIMGFGNELTPIVEEIQKNIFCAVRCNGMGVAIGSMIGEEIADLALDY